MPGLKCLDETFISAGLEIKITRIVVHGHGLFEFKAGFLKSCGGSENVKFHILPLAKSFFLLGSSPAETSKTFSGFNSSDSEFGSTFIRLLLAEGLAGPPPDTAG